MPGGDDFSRIHAGVPRLRDGRVFGVRLESVILEPLHRPRRRGLQSRGAAHPHHQCADRSRSSGTLRSSSTRSGPCSLSESRGPPVPSRSDIRRRSAPGPGSRRQALGFAPTRAPPMPRARREPQSEDEQSVEKLAWRSHSEQRRHRGRTTLANHTAHYPSLDTRP